MPKRYSCTSILFLVFKFIKCYTQLTQTLKLKIILIILQPIEFPFNICDSCDTLYKYIILQIIQ